VERARAAGVPVEFHTGRDMMHVWPYMPNPRDCRAALDHITRILSV
jgi:acetyl esterase/lipase